MSEKKEILYVSLRLGYGGATMQIDQLVHSSNKSYEIYCAAPVEKPYGQNWFERLGNTKYNY